MTRGSVALPLTSSKQKGGLGKWFNHWLDSFAYPTGHYYSPVPSLKDIAKRKAEIFEQDKIPAGIDLRESAQWALLQKFSSYYKDCPFDFMQGETPALRYQSSGAWYRFSDVVFLYSMMRHFRPRRIIEVGSGASSAVMLDVRDMWFSPDELSLTFIDPHPQRLFRQMKKADFETCTVIERTIQQTDLTLFDSLEAGDFLFIDTSHVSKVGSDVNHLFFEVLPRIVSGVFIHFHDIFYPFELPKDWILKKKRFWNENYLLRAFLMYNAHYEVVMFNSFLHKQYFDFFEEQMPACLEDLDNVGSIWIKKK